MKLISLTSLNDDLHAQHLLYNVCRSLTRHSLPILCQILNNSNHVLNRLPVAFYLVGLEVFYNISDKGDLRSLVIKPEHILKSPSPEIVKM